MPIPVTCECGQRFQTRDENAGRRARCPDCGREFQVPEPELFRIDDLEPRVLPVATTSEKAIASLFLGLCVCGMVFTGIPAVILGLFALREINRSHGRIKGKWLAIAGIALGILSTILMFMPHREALGGARRAQCVNNLKQIGLGLYNYRDFYGCFPPAAITAKNGKPLLSWRVTILPWIGQTALYNKFHRGEPWNSPHNLTLLNQMPNTYRCPSDPTLGPGQTTYQVIVDPHSIFRPDYQPVKIEEITDGTSNTIMIGETRRAVPWTAPEDLPLDLAVPLLGFGSNHPGGFNAALSDGSIKFLKTGISSSVLKALITRDGGEVIDANSY